MVFQHWFCLISILIYIEHNRGSIKIHSDFTEERPPFTWRQAIRHLILVLHPHSCHTPWPWNNLGLWTGYNDISKSGELKAFTWKVQFISLKSALNQFIKFKRCNRQKGLCHLATYKCKVFTRACIPSPQLLFSQRGSSWPPDLDSSHITLHSLSILYFSSRHFQHLRYFLGLSAMCSPLCVLSC